MLPRILLLALALLGAGGEAVAKALPLGSERQLVLLNLTGGLPGRWLTCANPCAPTGAGGVTLLRPAPEGGSMAWEIPGDPAATRALEQLEYDAELWPMRSGPVVILTSREPFQGIRLIHRYALSADGYTLYASLQIPAGARLRFTGGTDYLPPPMAGFGAEYRESRAVEVSSRGQVRLTEEGAAPVTGRALAAGDWAGLRSRFWTLLVRADSPLTVDAREAEANRPEISFGRASGGLVNFTFYAGPVEKSRLEAVDPVLANMLFAALWGWLRALCFGLLYLLGQIQSLVGNWGLAIMLLSLSVKVLMSPLTWVAERWQAAVNRTQTLLKPELDAIKREHKGEEAHRLTLEVYKRHGVSPFYTLKSLAGFLIQIPIFIAAFDMLGENFSLDGAGFLWVGDLALPDCLFGLPFTVPFFGACVNLLPILMTALTILASRLQEDANLSADLLAGQRLRLYAMAAVFFVLLYTFPAGMVLYWTTNNLLHLGRILMGRAFLAKAG